MIGAAPGVRRSAAMSALVDPAIQTEAAEVVVESVAVLGAGIIVTAVVSAK